MSAICRFHLILVSQDNRRGAFDSGGGPRRARITSHNLDGHTFKRKWLRCDDYNGRLASP
jgi:hypothetical protein